MAGDVIICKSKYVKITATPIGKQAEHCGKVVGLDPLSYAIIIETADGKDITKECKGIMGSCYSSLGHLLMPTVNIELTLKQLEKHVRKEILRK